MKRFPFIFIFCLSLIFSTFLQAQDDIENEYAYGTITNITDKEILLKEYNYEKLSNCWFWECKASYTDNRSKIS